MAASERPPTTIGVGAGRRRDEGFVEIEELPVEGGRCAAQELADDCQALVHPLPPCGWVDATDAHLVAILAADAHAEDEAARPEALEVGQLASHEDRVA